MANFQNHFGAKKLAAVSILLGIWCGSANAQLEATLERFTGANAKGYLKPLVDALATDFNRGWYHTAKIPKGFHLYIGSRAMATFVSEKNKTFRATTEGDFSPVQTVEAPTAIGDTKTVSVRGTGGSTYYFPTGFDLSSVLYAAPQVSLGSILGTEATFRYIALELGDNADIGKIDLFGVGIRHSLSQYLKDFPLDLSAGYFYQKFKVGNDFIDAASTHFGVQASKSFALLTLYGGLGFDAANIKVDYEPDSGGVPVELDIDGESGARFTVRLDERRKNDNAPSAKTRDLFLSFGMAFPILQEENSQLFLYFQRGHEPAAGSKLQWRITALNFAGNEIAKSARRSLKIM